MVSPLLTLVEYGRTRLAYDHCFRKLSHTPARAREGERGHRPSSLWYHRVRESFTRFSSVGTLENKALPVCCSFCSSRTAHPCKKKKRSKKEKLDARVLWMLLASDRGNEFPATEIISFDRPELAIISPPSSIFTSLFSFLFSRLRRGMECVWKRAEVVVGQFLNRWLSL